MASLLIALLLTPAAALAQASDPTGAEYNDRVQQVQAGGGGGDPGDGLGGRVVDPLPFTGFDVIAMAAVALAVTGLGLALQRAVSRERQGFE